MNDTEELLKVVPTDETEALGFRDIHKRFGVWSPTTVRVRLNDLVSAGVVKTRVERFRPGPMGTINVYYAPSVDDLARDQ